MVCIPITCGSHVGGRTTSCHCRHPQCGSVGGRRCISSCGPRGLGQVFGRWVHQEHVEDSGVGIRLDQRKQTDVYNPPRLSETYADPYTLRFADQKSTCVLACASRALLSPLTLDQSLIARSVNQIRVLRGIFYQLYLQPTPQPPKHLFAPLITSSRNSLYDCDYNLHKSNSTYFADLDIARAHTVGCIIRTGLARLNRGDEDGLPAAAREAKGKYAVALGGVSCSFQRQIEPLQSFEIYTRVLSCCLLYTSPSPRDGLLSRMPSSA